MQERFLGVFFLIGAFSLAGTSVVAGRFVAATLGTFTITVVSLIFALGGLLPLCAENLLKSMGCMTRRDWVMVFIQALFGIFLFRMLLLEGLVLTSAGEAGILTGATPATTLLLAWLFLREHIDKVRLLGVISTIMGIVVLQGMFSSDIVFSARHLLGNFLVLCAALCESIFNLFSRINSIAVKNLEQELDPIVQTTLVVSVAMLLCLAPALTEQPVAALLSLSLSGWVALVWYGLFVTALAFILWYAGIKRCDVSVAAAFSGMMPCAALILSVLLLNEQPTWQQWLGGLLVVLGMMLTGWQKPQAAEALSVHQEVRM